MSGNPQQVDVDAGDAAPLGGLLDALDDEQRAVAQALNGPVCVIAGAGTGKTRAITHRIAHGVHIGAYSPTSVLAVTFTVKAAGEMRQRLAALGVQGVQSRTFHSAALRQARFFWPAVTGDDLPPIIDSKLALVGRAAKRARVVGEAHDLAAEIEWAKVSNVLPEAYATAAGRAGREAAGIDHALVGKVYSAYEDVKSAAGSIDLEDVLLAAVGLLETHDEVASRIRAQYRHLVVDEYQDVSPLQQRLLELWLGPSQEVCVVGDPAQTIYSFAGARADYLVTFAQRHPEATVVRLVRDYRSTPQVVGVANAVLAKASDAAGKGGVRLVAQRPPGPVATYVEYSDEPAEASGVAEAIAELRRSGVASREIAVLYRINAQSEAVEDALTQAGIAYTVRGDRRFFDRAEVRQALLLLRGAAQAAGSAPTPDDAAAPLPLAGPVRGGSARDDVPPLGAEVRAVLAGIGWTQTPPTTGGTPRERWESLAALIALADDVARAQPTVTLRDLVTELQARADAQHAPAPDGVTLATFHAAKGLEWDAVFLLGCHEGALPYVRATTPAQVEEERRLLYVGITRARENLSVSWSRARAPGGGGRRSATRFLDGVRPVSAAATTPTASPRNRSLARCRVCGLALSTAVERKLGRCQDCPGNVDEAVFERLRMWRRDLAAEQKVPAYVIFTDATLTAIAEQRPADHTALGRIPGVGAVKLERYGDAVLHACLARSVEAETTMGTASEIAATSADDGGPSQVSGTEPEADN